MNKRILIILVNFILLAVLIMGGAYFFFTRQSAVKTTQVSTLTPPTLTPYTSQKTAMITPGQTVTQSTSTLTVSTNGAKIPLKNFYSDPQTQILDKQGDALISDDLRYSINYNAIDGSFSIAITGNDLKTSRAAAEDGFLKKLGITEYQACQLSVTVGVPNFISANASGVDYGLSFCSNGKPIPTNAGPGASPL